MDAAQVFAIFKEFEQRTEARIATLESEVAALKARAAFTPSFGQLARDRPEVKSAQGG